MANAVDSRIESTRRGAEQINALFQSLGRQEQIRRERKELDDIVKIMAGGVTIDEAIMRVANQPPEIDPGFRGLVQRIGGRFQPEPGRITSELQRGIISGALKRALAPEAVLTPEERIEAARIRAGLLPRAAVQPKPFEPTRAAKAIDRDIKALADEDTPQPRKQAARERLRQNPELREIQPGALDDQFEKGIKGKPKVKVGKVDRAFGKEAYDKTLQELKDAALAQGATEASMEVDFNRWWDEQAALKDPKGFGKRMIPRLEFQGAQITPPKITEIRRLRRTVGEEKPIEQLREGREPARIPRLPPAQFPGGTPRSFASEQEKIEELRRRGVPEETIRQAIQQSRR